MKFMCVATPLLAAVVMGLPADAGANVRAGQAGEHLAHARAITQPDRPATSVGGDFLRQAVAQQPSGAVRRPPPSGGGGGGNSGGGSGGGGGATASGGRSGGDGGDRGGAVTRGEARRRADSGDQASGNERAVPRGSVRPRPRGYTYPYYYYRPNPWYYDRWGYGGFGLGYFYYSPWSWYGPGPGYYGYGGWGRDDGGVRLKVKPRDAEVLVDGYFAGSVDDFDGNFQSLKLDAGSYRIEVRKPGFESLTFDVRIQRDRTITFRGEMKAQP